MHGTKEYGTRILVVIEAPTVPLKDTTGYAAIPRLLSFWMLRGYYYVSYGQYYWQAQRIWGL